MRNTNVGILLTLLVALSTSLAEASTVGEILSSSAPLSSKNTTSPEQEWSSLRPAAKAAAQASECLSVDVAALTGDALTNYLRTTSEGCLSRTLHISSNPSIRADVPTIFSNRNMQSVLAKIEELAVGYDGTNSTGMLQLWFFVQNPATGTTGFFQGRGWDRSTRRPTVPTSPRRMPLPPATTFMPPTTRPLRSCTTTSRLPSLLGCAEITWHRSKRFCPGLLLNGRVVGHRPLIHGLSLRSYVGYMGPSRTKMKDSPYTRPSWTPSHRIRNSSRSCYRLPAMTFSFFSKNPIHLRIGYDC